MLQVKNIRASTAARVITYGIDHEADFRATNIKMDVNGTSFDLINPFGIQSSEDEDDWQV